MKQLFSHLVLDFFKGDVPVRTPTTQSLSPPIELHRASSFRDALYATTLSRPERRAPYASVTNLFNPRESDDPGGSASAPPLLATPPAEPREALLLPRLEGELKQLKVGAGGGGARRKRRAAGCAACRTWRRRRSCGCCCSGWTCW